MLQVVLIVVLLVVVLLVVFYKRHHAQQSIVSIIGVGLTIKNQALEIQSVLPDTPAAEAGLRPGLIIQQIDGTDTAGKPLVECFDMTRGPIGSKIHFVVIDPVKDQTNIVEVTRKRFVVRDAH